MGLDDDLRAHLRGAATRLELAPASLADVEARGRRRRRRNRVGGALAVFALVAGVLGGSSMLRDRSDGGGDIAAEGGSRDDAAGRDSASAQALVGTQFGGPYFLLPWGDGFVSVGSGASPRPMPELSQELLDRLPPEIREALADDPPETVEAAFARLDEAGLGDRAVDLILGNAELSEAFFGSTPYADPPVLRRSPDGLVWETIEVEFGVGGSPMHAASDGERLAVVMETHAEGGASGSSLFSSAVVVASTDDLEVWDVQELPVELPTDLPDWVHPYVSASALGVGEAGWVVVVSIGLGHEFSLPDAYGGTAAVEGWATRDDGVEFYLLEDPSVGGAAASTSTVVAEPVFLTWEELGVDPADAERYLGGFADELQLWVGRPGVAPVRATTPPVTWVGQLVATDTGFALIGDGDGIAQPFVSSDGLAWRPADRVELGREEYLAGLARIDGGLLVVVEGPAGSRILRGDTEGRGWEEVTVPGLAPGGGFGWWYPCGSASGCAVVVDLAPRASWVDLEYRWEVEFEGYALVVTASGGTTAYELSDLARGVVVSSERDDGRGGAEPFLHAREVGSRVVFSDPETGEELVAMPLRLLGDAEEAASQEAARDDGVSGEPRPDPWLVATVDGERWLVERLGGEESDVGWPGYHLVAVNAAAAAGPTVVLFDGVGWRSLPLR